MATLEELESRLQALIEVNLLEYLTVIRDSDQIPRIVAEAMHSNLQIQPDGSMLAPNMYVLIAHPVTLSEWRSDPMLLEGLEEALYQVGRESGFKFATHPHISTSADISMRHNTVRVIASSSAENVAETKDMPAELKTEIAEDAIPSNAFLIQEGTKVVSLNRTVINIGRRLDNHVVIDDPRVSRTHAQLRAIKGRFVLFDLNSSGGTYINGQRTNQTVLYPGDVISLAGVTLIFGQDIPATRRGTTRQTGAFRGGSGDRPTAVLGIYNETPEE